MQMTGFEQKLEEMLQRMEDPAVMVEAMQLCHDYNEPMPDWLVYLLIGYIKDIAERRKIN
jgi:hypothetical protein